MATDAVPPEPELGGIAKEAQRLTAGEILAAVVETGRNELERPMAGLGLSAVAGGITVGLSALAVALVRAALEPSPLSHLAASLVYPIGFIAVIIGRAQFFTENTLYPVVVYLSERRHGGRLLLFWAVVLAGNLIGAAAFALLAMDSGALATTVGEAARAQMIVLGRIAATPSAATVFWGGVIGGWIMALVAWMVSASHWTSGQIMVTWLLTFLLGLGEFVHSIATSAEILAAVAARQLDLSAYLQWLGPAVAGNLVGGVLIVSLLNYGQVKAGRVSSQESSNARHAPAA